MPGGPGYVTSSSAAHASGSMPPYGSIARRAAISSTTCCARVVMLSAIASISSTCPEIGVVAPPKSYCTPTQSIGAVGSGSGAPSLGSQPLGSSGAPVLVSPLVDPSSLVTGIGASPLLLDAPLSSLGVMVV